jgi:hypothetical protein
VGTRVSELSRDQRERLPDHQRRIRSSFCSAGLRSAADVPMSRLNTLDDCDYGVGSLPTIIRRNRPYDHDANSSIESVT